MFHFEGQTRDLHDVSSFQLAFDSLTEGPDFPGYPLPLDAKSPDELADISGFTCGQSWTITLAGELPDSVWDGTTTGRSRWPLATLWGDEDNHVAILADAEDGRLVARITAGGFITGTIELADLFWVRGSQLRISIAQNAGGIEMTASVGSIPLVSASSNASLSVTPTRIRFGAPEPAIGGGDPPGGGPVGSDDFEVCAFAWFGGQIDEQTFLDQTQREQLLQGLEYLASGENPCPADLTDDGNVDPADLAVLLGTWGSCDPPAACDADINGDGLVDPADLAIVLGSWGPCAPAE